MLDVYIVDVNDDDVTGYTTYKTHLTRITVALGHNCHNIVLSSHHKYLCVERKDEIEVIYVPKCGMKEMGVLLKLYIKDRNTNVFMQHFSTSYPTLNMLSHNFPKSKLVYVIHDFIWATYVLGNLKLFKRIVEDDIEHLFKDKICASYEDGIQTFNLVDKVVCLSSDTKHLLQELYHVDVRKIVQIPNGLEDNVKNFKAKYYNLRETYNISMDDCIYLFVGRMTEQKGFFDLLQAFCLLKKNVKKVKLVCAGKFDSSIIRFIDNSIKKDVILLGQIDKNELYAWYKETDFGVIASYYEQCSYVALEMMSFSVPIIAEDSMGVKCLFDNNNSFFVKNKEENRRCIALFLKMEQAFYSSNSKIDLIRKNSRKDYEQNYSIEVMKDNYKDKLFDPLCV